MPWPDLFAGWRSQANATQENPPASSAAAQHGWWLPCSGSGLCLLQNGPDQRLATHGLAITHDDARESFASGGYPFAAMPLRLKPNEIHNFRLFVIVINQHIQALRLGQRNLRRTKPRDVRRTPVFPGGHIIDVPRIHAPVGCIERGLGKHLGCNSRWQLKFQVDTIVWNRQEARFFRLAVIKEELRFGRERNSHRLACAMLLGGSHIRSECWAGWPRASKRARSNYRDREKAFHISDNGSRNRAATKNCPLSKRPISPLRFTAWLFGVRRVMSQQGISIVLCGHRTEATCFPRHTRQ